MNSIQIKTSLVRISALLVSATSIVASASDATVNNKPLTAQITSPGTINNQMPPPPPIATVQVFMSDQGTLSQIYPPPPPPPNNALSVESASFNGEPATYNPPPLPPPTPDSAPYFGGAQNQAAAMPSMPPTDGDGSQPLGVAAVELVAEDVVAQSEGMSAPIMAIKPKIISVQALPMPTNDNGKSIKPGVTVIKLKTPKDPPPFFPED